MRTALLIFSGFLHAVAIHAALYFLLR